MFDDTKGRELKMMTDQKRYKDPQPDLELNRETKVEVWASVFGSRSNKTKLKTLIFDLFIEESQTLLSDGQTLYLQGEGSKVIKLMKIGGEVTQTELFPVMSEGESDLKIFEFLQYCRKDKLFGNILIYSLDTDVKFLSVVFSSLFTNLKIVVKSQKTHHTFFFPGEVVNYIEGNLSADSVYEHTLSLLTTYIMCGVDHNPGFHLISHTLALQTWAQMSKKHLLRNTDDYLELILNTYERREPGLKKMFFTPGEAENLPIEARHGHVRSVIKARRAVESETVPILSVLHPHIQRSIFLANKWINPSLLHTEPLDNGWELDGDGNHQPVLQDTTDKYFILPSEILKGCSCKKKCSESRRCGCKKSEFRGNCSKITCRNCSCFNEFPELGPRISALFIHDEDELMEEMEEEDNDEEADEEEDIVEEESDWDSDCDDDDVIPVDQLDDEIM